MMTNKEMRLAREIKHTLSKNLVGEFVVEVRDNLTTISSPDFSANGLWDEIDANALLGRKALGWMSADQVNDCVHVDTNMIEL
jgi:hypothetical protein